MIDLNQLWADEMNGKVPAGTYRKEKHKQYPPKVKDLKIPKLELAFKNQKISGIVLNNRLIEDGEVVEYIKKLEIQLDKFSMCRDEDNWWEKEK